MRHPTPDTQGSVNRVAPREECSGDGKIHGDQEFASARFQFWYRVVVGEACAGTNDGFHWRRMKASFFAIWEQCVLTFEQVSEFAFSYLRLKRGVREEDPLR